MPFQSVKNVLRSACRIAIGIAATLFVALYVAAAEFVVIDLHNRTADELLPVLRPLAGSASLSGLDYKLFVRGDAADLARIREMLVVLDRAPQQLLISVRYSSSPLHQDSSIHTTGVVTEHSATVVASGQSTLSTASDSSIATVRVLEGNGAHISTGQSVPIVSSMLFSQGTKNRGPTAALGTDYRDLSSGFDVLPRVNGDRVVLEISSQQQRLSDQGAGSADTHRTTTTVAGRVGDWIEVGGVSDSSDDQRTSFGLVGGSRHTSTQSAQRTIAVKVEKSE